MKRILSIILPFVIIMLCTANASAREKTEYLSRVQAVQEIISTLYLSGEDEGFDVEYLYCLHPGGGGYVHFVPDEALQTNGYPLLCELYSIAESGFSDISQENDNLSVYITLAKAMGIINGYGDNTFRPERLITREEAVTMLVRAFGYGELGKSMGGYPGGYIKAAEETGITDGVSVVSGDMVSREDFDTMLKNAVNNASEVIKNQMVVFVPPVTPQQCVEAYAQAVKERNGGIQFALFDDELKDSLREDFIALNWVTGVSSPWVYDYSINQTGELNFEIIFRYKSSAGPEFENAVDVAIRQINMSYRITAK